MKNLRVSDKQSNCRYHILFDAEDIICVLVYGNDYDIISNEELIELLDKTGGYVNKITHAVEFEDYNNAKIFLEEFLLYYNMYLLRGGK